MASKIGSRRWHDGYLMVILDKLSWWSIRMTDRSPKIVKSFNMDFWATASISIRVRPIWIFTDDIFEKSIDFLVSFIFSAHAWDFEESLKQTLAVANNLKLLNKVIEGPFADCKLFEFSLIHFRSSQPFPSQIACMLVTVSFIIYCPFIMWISFCNHIVNRIMAIITIPFDGLVWIGVTMTIVSSYQTLERI